MAKDEEQSRIWSTVGATLPIPDTYASIRFSFGHERYAKSSDPKDLRKAEAEMHEFNKKVLEDRLNEHRDRLAELVAHKKKKGKKK